MKKIIVLVLTVALLASLCACSASRQFVGTWQGKVGTGENCKLTIKAKGTYILQVDGASADTGEWEKLDNSTLLLKTSGMFGGTITVTCTVENGTMYIKTGSFSWKTAELRKN